MTTWTILLPISIEWRSSFAGAGADTCMTGTQLSAIRNSCIVFPSDAEGMGSVFCHSEYATGVYETRLIYPLNDAALHNTYPLGIGN